jgi:hypothetical protein
MAYTNIGDVMKEISKQSILQQVRQKHEQMREHLNSSDIQQLFQSDLDPRITYRLCKLYIETFDHECEE